MLLLVEYCPVVSSLYQCSRSALALSTGSENYIIIFRSQICPFLRLVSLRVVNTVQILFAVGGDSFFMETLLKAGEMPGGRHLLRTNYVVLLTTRIHSVP